MAGVWTGPTTSSAATCTSTSREASAAPREGSGRSSTVPRTRTTVSAPRPAVRAITSGGVHAGLQESWTRPARSRRSTKTSPPRSRRRCTQPPSRTSRPTSARVSAPARWERNAVAAGLARFGVDEDAIELIWGPGVDQPLADVLPPYQPGDATQNLDVESRGRIRAHDEKEQADRLAVDGIEGDRRLTHAADDDQLLDPRRSGVGNRHPEPDAGG